MLQIESTSQPASSKTLALLLIPYEGHASRFYWSSCIETSTSIAGSNPALTKPHANVAVSSSTQPSDDACDSADASGDRGGCALLFEVKDIARGVILPGSRRAVVVALRVTRSYRRTV